MKRCATLLEALVALTLTAGLFSLLLGAYLRATRTHAAVGETIWPQVQVHALHQRLSQLIPNISATDPHVASDGHALTFIYHNGIDDDPHFSAEVAGHLTLDSHRRLVLTSWPSPHRWELAPTPVRHETLTSSQTLSFEFYEREEGWFDNWDREELPTLIKINTDALTYTYDLPNANKPVRYRK